MYLCMYKHRVSEQIKPINIQYNTMCACIYVCVRVASCCIVLQRDVG